MDQPSFPPYSPFADCLSKFYLASEPIQALWIVALSATVLGVTWIVMRGLREVVNVVVRQSRGNERLINRVRHDVRVQCFAPSWKAWRTKYTELPSYQNYGLDEEDGEKLSTEV